MTARVLMPGDRSIDYSGARPAPASTRKAGASAIHRYSAGVGNGQAATQWKLCGKDELAAAVAAGMDFIANSEWYTSRVTEGAAAGGLDGRADFAFWHSRGLAKGASIYCSWDEAPVRSKWPAVMAYLHAYDVALGGYYHVDCYAGTPFLRYALSRKAIRHGWRPNAGSWSSDGLPYQPDTSTAPKRAALIARALKATPAAIWQTGNYWWSKSADENLVLRPAGSHLQALATAAMPVPATPHPSPHPSTPHYPLATVHAHDLIAVGREFAYVPTNDGRIDVRRNGVHVYYIGSPH